MLTIILYTLAIFGILFLYFIGIIIYKIKTNSGIDCPVKHNKNYEEIENQTHILFSNKVPNGKLYFSSLKDCENFVNNNREDFSCCSYMQINKINIK